MVTFATIDGKGVVVDRRVNKKAVRRAATPAGEVDRRDRPAGRGTRTCSHPTASVIRHRAPALTGNVAGWLIVMTVRRRGKTGRGGHGQLPRPGPLKFEGEKRPVNCEAVHLPQSGAGATLLPLTLEPLHAGIGPTRGIDLRSTRRRLRRHRIIDICTN